MAVGLPSKLHTVDADFTDVEEVGVRPVRFRTEAFWGLDGEILVIQEDVPTTELALPSTLARPLYDRLSDQLLHHGFA